MIKTAQDAYLAGRQAAMEKIAGLPAGVAASIMRPGYIAGTLGRYAGAAAKNLTRNPGKVRYSIPKALAATGILGAGIYGYDQLGKDPIPNLSPSTKRNK